MEREYKKQIKELNDRMKSKERDDQERIKELKSYLDELKTLPDFEENIFEESAKGKLACVIYLLANGTKVNEQYKNDKYDKYMMKNSTPLHFSSLFGHLSVVEYLIKHKADINAIRCSVAIFSSMKLLFI